MFKYPLLIFSAFLFAGCATLGTQSNAGYRAGTADEYAVYSAIIKELYLDGRNRLIVINGHTAGNNITARPPEEDLRLRNQQLSPAEREAVDDYNAKNKETRLIERQFNLDVEYLLVDRNAFQKSLGGKEGDEGWRAFYEKYPNSPGYITLSRVGFNPGGTKAFVYIANECGGTCGNGTYLILARQGEKWTVERRIAVWAS